MGNSPRAESLDGCRLSGGRLPAVHRVASLAKRWILGTHQGALDSAHSPSYLDEFVFQFNRRRSRSRGMLFYRVLELAVVHFCIWVILGYISGMAKVTLSIEAQTEFNGLPKSLKPRVLDIFHSPPVVAGGFGGEVAQARMDWPCPHSGGGLASDLHL